MLSRTTIPPSSGTREALRSNGSFSKSNGGKAASAAAAAAAASPSSSSNPSHSPRKQRAKARLSSTWLWLNGVCLTLNIGLMIILFAFHAHWMPRATTNVMKSHLRNRREFWKLLQGQHTTKEEEEDLMDKHPDNNVKQRMQELPTTRKEPKVPEKKAAVPPPPVKKPNEEKKAPSSKNELEHKEQVKQEQPKESPAQKEESSPQNYKNEIPILPFTKDNSPNSESYDVSKQQYHIIFSTGCSIKQHWQSYMLYYSIISSGQTGQVTRIASGCTDEEAQGLVVIHKEQIQPMGKIGLHENQEPTRFHLHMTPEFGAGFHYNNKPYGVAHWMEHVLGYGRDKPSTDHDDTILFLLDPDMVIMRPFVNDFSHNEMWIPRTSFPYMDRVKHGYPMASEYGYKNQWFLKTNITAIVGKTPITDMKQAEIDENYHAGPPYVATAQDFYKIVTRWRFLAQPIHQQYPALLSEMFAYSAAAADLQLPHQLARSFMVSDWKEPGLDLVTKNDKITADQMCRNVPIDFKPHVLHYCQRLALGKYIMSKHRLPDDFVGQDVSCEKPLLMEPPDDVALKYDFFVDIQSGQRHDIRDAKNGAYKQQTKINQAAFLLCEELQAFNKAATYFKQHHCPADKQNLAKTFLFFDSTELTDKEKDAPGVIV